MFQYGTPWFGKWYQYSATVVLPCVTYFDNGGESTVHEAFYASNDLENMLSKSGHNTVWHPVYFPIEKSHFCKCSHEKSFSEVIKQC